MNTRKKLCWKDGIWSSNEQLSIHIDDRGLNFGDGIFETIFVDNGFPQLFKEHISRWQKNAQTLCMAPPPKQEIISPIIEEGINLLSLKDSSCAIRPNWSRGRKFLRGTDIYETTYNKSSNQFWIEFCETKPDFNPITTIISQKEKRNAESQVNQCKTFNYIQSIHARQEAKLSGWDAPTNYPHT